MAITSAAFFTLLLLLLTFPAQSRDTPPPTPIATTIIAPPPDNNNHPSSTPFRPGIAIVVCVLTTIISLTSLLLLYTKHCNGGNTDGGGRSTPWTVAPFGGRKNSGIDRSVVESLPVFRFGALQGQKEGLDCAVCLNKFEEREVLRLLPKCKHAFHVECVDTWLDAHSTCPLCRYRVDPEDILLMEDTKPNFRHKAQERVRLNLDLEKQQQQENVVESRRRHSSVGEREMEQTRSWTASFRRSLDSISGTASRKKNESGVGVGCFVRARKDGMLLTQERDKERDGTSLERRLEHRIIVSPGPGPGAGGGGGPCGLQQRWSDAQASDLLYLTSEMIMSESQWNTRGGGERKGTRRTNSNEDSWSRRGILNSRSVSEITGLRRFELECDGERQEGLVKRWLLGWISKSHSHSHSQPSVR